MQIYHCAAAAHIVYKDKVRISIVRSYSLGSFFLLNEVDHHLLYHRIAIYAKNMLKRSCVTHIHFIHQNALVPGVQIPIAY